VGGLLTFEKVTTANADIAGQVSNECEQLVILSNDLRNVSNKFKV